MNYRNLYQEGLAILKTAGIDNAEYDARALLLFAANMDVNTYLLHSMDELCEEDVDLPQRYHFLIERRKTHEPLQYITNTADFYGREFFVKSGVLIPRYDTETLIEAALPRIQKHDRILDVCTGSGCILLTLLLESDESVTGVGLDLSDQALEIAGINQRKLLSKSEEKRAVFLKSDLFEHAEGVFDLIVSNPPYIESDVIGSLSPEVREHEPLMALDGTIDGLEFYRRITRDAEKYLKKGGTLALEIGYQQGEAVKRLLLEHSYGDVKVIKDLGNQDRVVMGTLI